jgi:DNA invertase Pin-like site-specific DNA recombinase
MNFGYARVSTKEQNLDTQLEALRAAGVDRIFQEKITGTTTSRPELDEMVRLLRPGDTVTVARLSRLGRSSSHLLQLVADFTEKGVGFVSLDLGIDTTTPTGRMVLGIFAALAEYEREGNRERSLAGIALAKAQGKHIGRRPGVNAAALEKVKTSLAAGLSVSQIVQVTGISETSVKRYRKLLA